MKIDASSMEWIRKPKTCQVTKDKVEIITEPHTDLWQRTYYHFRNDNAPVLQMKTTEQFFSFVVRTDFDSKIKPNTLLRNGAYRIVMRGAKSICAGASLWGRNSAPLCRIKLDTATEGTYHLH